MAKTLPAHGKERKHMTDPSCEHIASFPKDEIEKRKDLVRKAWNYEKIDHVPICMSLDYNPWGYTMQEQLMSDEIQFKLRMHSCEQSLKLLPDDYIPCAFVDVGCVGISQAFGAKVYRSDNPQQTPGVRGHVLGSIEDTYDLKAPDLRHLDYETEGAHSDTASDVGINSGGKGGGIKSDDPRNADSRSDAPQSAEMVRTYLHRLKYFYERTQGSVYLSGIDNNGPTGIAMDLLGSEELFVSMIEEPEAVLHFLKVIDDAIIDEIDASIEILDGDINHMTSTDYFFCWCPEGKKGHASADLCATYSPELFRKFDYYANGRIYEKYGAGLMHNCGPNPCVFEYANQYEGFSGLNLAYQYSSCDLEKIKQAMRGKIVYFSYDFPETAIADYQHTMEILAPDVIAIPLVRITDESIDPRAYYGSLRRISEEYAHRVFG